ncbi:MAG: hypothetical protein JXR89_12085 [Deltaproteobacteria bacterium]|nr:hypothetical protein [Deltaproteobacteria bacterium]
MLNAGQFTLSQEEEFFSACRVLFGSDIEVNRDFLAYLQLEGIRRAYLNLAKTTHPDRFPGADLNFLKQKAEFFSRLTGAYDTLSAFIKARSRGVAFAARDRFEKVSPSAKDFVATPRSQRAGGAWTTTGAAGDIFFSSRGGGLPPRHLPLGLFLYYRGYISYQDLARALVWQRSQRPRLGEISRRWGRLSEEEIKVVLRCRDQSAGRFGEKAVALGLLNRFQVDTMIHYQRRRQRPLGRFFVEQGLLPQVMLEKLLLELHDHNERVIIDNSFRRRFFGIFF